MAEKKVPFGTYLFGAMGAAALIRAVWNPHRALVKKGRITVCPGAECSHYLTIEADCGSDIYAAGGGRVVLAEPGRVHIRVSNEPVILEYEGLMPRVKEGQYVLRGQPLGFCMGGDAAPLYFGVWEVLDAGGVAALEPSAWLASRGYRIAVKSTGDEGMWCEQGRRIVIPKQVHTDCKLGAGSEPSFALLPISVREA